MIVEERVSQLEVALSRFIEQTSMIVAAIHQDIAEIRASNARTDRKLLELHKVAEYRGKLAQVREFFPEWASKTICPAVASVYLDASVIAFLNREKIYGIAMGDEVMEVVNLGQF